MMKLADLVGRWGSQANVADVFDVRPQAVFKWRKRVPERVQVRAVILDPTLEPDSETLDTMKLYAMAHALRKDRADAAQRDKRLRGEPESTASR